MELKKIASIRTGFATKFGIPRQSGLIESLEGKIVFEKPYRTADALRGLDGFSHIWLLWGFSAGFSGKESRVEKWSPTVRPPRLGGNRAMGVFATRSPNRPNPIGLSCVSLQKIEMHPEDGPILWVSGIDMMDGTPIYDIKPYLPHADCVPEAVGGFSAEHVDDTLEEVVIPNDCRAVIPDVYWQSLQDVLKQDPRPSYQHDAAREYGFPFYGFEVRFRVVEKTVYVTHIQKL